MDGDVLNSVQPVNRTQAPATPSVSLGLNGEGPRCIGAGMISTSRKMVTGSKEVG